MIKATTVLGSVLLAGAVAFAQADKPAASAAKATLKDAKGQTLGDVTLRETPQGVLMSVDLRNVPPGVKAFHIHDTGSCEGPTFQSAGPHFNPVKKSHGLMNPAGPHAGDLPNVHVPQNGAVSFEVLAPGVMLDSGVFDANGSAVVLHAKADDYTTDPAGNAGDRIACGVLTR